MLYRFRLDRVAGVQLSTTIEYCVFKNGDFINETNINIDLNFNANRYLNRSNSNTILFCTFLYVLRFVWQQIAQRIRQHFKRFLRRMF